MYNVLLFCSKVVEAMRDAARRKGSGDQLTLGIKVACANSIHHTSKWK